MKIKIALLIAGICTLVLVFTAGSPAAPHAKAVPTALSSADPGQPAAAAAREPHPEIREAIASLRRAKAHMEHAAHDFGGHRVEAIRATDDAIHQLEECLRFDKD